MIKKLRRLFFKEVFMMISIKNFLRPLILVLAVIFMTISLTGCTSTINTIRTISQTEKARKVFKGAMNAADVIDLKRNVDDLANKILKHK